MSLKAIIFKLILFLTICMSMVAVLLVNYGGYVDFFYEKFTTPEAKSMIIGDSRSLQGIHPDVVDTIFQDSEFEVPITNYSFTMAQAVFGPLYTKSILKKIDPQTKKGIFVISATPVMLCSHKNLDINKGEFEEAGQPPHNMEFVAMNPNFEYLFKNFSYFHFKGLLRQKSKLHKNGWLEDNNLPKTKKDLISASEVQKRIVSENAHLYQFSKYRVKSLDTLIQKLKPFGKVYLTRLPIDNSILELEQQFNPEFRNVLDSIAHKNNIPYFDFNNRKGDNKYKTYDGQHISKNDVARFTRALCDSIKTAETKFKYTLL